MDLQEVVCEDVGVNILEFWRGIKIWLSNPHVVNRRILGSSEILIANTKHNASEIIVQIEELDVTSQVLNDDKGKINVALLLGTLNITENCIVYNSLDFLDNIDNGTYLYIKKLVPRNSDLFSPTLEFVIIEKNINRVIYVHKSFFQDKQSLAPTSIYDIKYDEGFVSINVNKNLVESAGVRWLKDKLYPRLIKWMKNESNTNLISGSLAHVSYEKYAELYEKLKKKYGTEMVRIWPECTDPAKFVYEDIAIATYLLLLWEKEREEKGIEKLQSFMDIGCGNGLLVYILSSEGHEGVGVDLRKRKIWDLFPETTHLQVQTIVPSSDTIFPNIDWFIGNHSDELTPWIPVISARSSYTSRFFLLPCCFYEFDGRKYKRDNALMSQYFEYINYVKTVCNGCGFRTLIDRLRIPSTKRICLIGWERTYKEENTEAQDVCIRNIINARTMPEDPNNQNVKLNNAWSSNFQPRNPKEKVRNCTQLNKTLISDIVHVVTSNLLNEGRRITLKERPGVIWNAGRRLNISEIVKIVPTEMLKQLRKECGGLQTLLKNHSYIFEVREGKVQFRIPGNGINTKQRKSTVSPKKVKPCWFHKNHPDGCPFTDLACNFKH